MINHNPNNVKVGEWAILDDNTKYPLLIFSMTPNKMFSQVGNLESVPWNVMTDRLKPIKKIENESC